MYSIRKEFDVLKMSLFSWLLKVVLGLQHENNSRVIYTIFYTINIMLKQ